MSNIMFVLFLLLLNLCKVANSYFPQGKYDSHLKQILTYHNHSLWAATVNMLLLLLQICQLLLSALMLVLILRSLSFLHHHHKQNVSKNCDNIRPSFLCHSILAWMSEMEVTMRRANRLEASLARMEKILSENQAAIQGVMTTGNSYNNNTSNEGADTMERRRWWRRRRDEWAFQERSCCAMTVPDWKVSIKFCFEIQSCSLYYWYTSGVLLVIHGWPLTWMIIT